MLNYTPEDIEHMTYADLEAKRELLLNLKDLDYAQDLLTRLENSAEDRK